MYPQVVFVTAGTDWLAWKNYFPYDFLDFLINYVNTFVAERNLTAIVSEKFMLEMFEVNDGNLEVSWSMNNC